jgi:CRISPR/Cas system-associated exonuclease Cas4 (RecB family)
MSTIRASDIGNYLYCRRAWWYRKQGVETENQAELTAGTQLHRQHGRKVLAASLLRNFALLLVLIALVLLAVYFTLQVLP